MSFGHVYHWRDRLVSKTKEREIVRSWIAKRLSVLLPGLMKREGIDMWIVAAKECNEDPVIAALTGSQMARRQTILVLYLGPSGALEAINVSRYSIDVPGVYRDAWNPEGGESQWACLARVVKERNPKVIGINTSDTFAFADGLSYGQYGLMSSALGQEYSDRFTSAQELAVGLLETRISEEMDAYPGLLEITHGLIAEAFSSRVIHPGVTTAGEALGWFNSQLPTFGCSYVKIQRQGVIPPATGSDQDFGELRDAIIRPGDVLRCDCGLNHLGLHTDVQQNAYVLGPGETEAPLGLRTAMVNANRLQDILAGEFVVGRTGNEILSSARAKALEEGLKPCIYAHAIGNHDHGAGLFVGMWDQQQGVPGVGDHPLYANTCYAFELNIQAPVPEWGGQEVTMALEEDVFFDGRAVTYINGRQRQFHLIR